jgi:hypothetical protein
MREDVQDHTSGAKCTNFNIPIYHVHFFAEHSVSTSVHEIVLA